MGPVRAQVGGEVVPVGPRQQRLVLAVLALEVNRPVPIDRIVEWVWPDNAPRSAKHAVQVQVSTLRTILPWTITAHGPSYQLNADPQRIDVYRFHDLIGRARVAGNDQARLALLNQALGLWTGAALADTVTPDIRERLCGGLVQTYLAAMEDRFDALLRLGRHAEVLGDLTAEVDSHPTRERLVRQLMLALHRAGQTDKALALARRTRTLLADELGIDPGTELQQLELGILRGDQALAPPRHRQAPARRSLPAARTRLLGRDDLVADICLRLTANGPRLVTLTGPGGVGKTQLGLEIARRSVPQFTDGAVFVPLAPVTDPDGVLAAIAGSLGIQDMAGVPARTTLEMYLRDRHLLLVLDNLEHLPAAASEIAWLLDATQGLTVLATGRTPLRLRGEQVRPVEPLEPPTAAELFTERAIQAGARHDELDPALVDAICHGVDRLPLAIELAAARARLLPLAVLLDHLQQSHDLLSDGAHDLPDRHRTLRETIAWSYDLLAPDEQAMLCCLAVFVGGWSAPAAAAVSDVDATTAVRLLGKLLDASLITRQHDRFALLETVRAFALEQAGGTRPAIEARHAAYFTDIEIGPTDPGDYFRYVLQEQANLRASMRWLLREGHLDRFVTFLCFHPYWLHGSHLQEYARVVPAALADDSRPWSIQARAIVLGMYGFVLFGSDREEATRICEEAMRLALLTDDLTVRALARLGLGHIAMWTDDNERAEVLLGQAESGLRELGWTSALTTARATRANVVRTLGRAEEANRLLLELETEKRGSGVLWDLAMTLCFRGLVLIELGDWELADRLEREALVIADQIGAGLTMMFVLTYLSVTAALGGRPHRSARLAGAAAVLVEQFGTSMVDNDVARLTERTTAEVVAQLGQDEFDALVKQGRAMAWQETVAFATGGDAEKAHDER